MTELEALLDQAAAIAHQQDTPPASQTEVSASAPETADSAAGYLVRYGDTLETIAAACGVPLALLMAFNGLINDSVPVGARLRIA